jgi:hypothetical protein
MVYYRGLRSSFASGGSVAELCFPATAMLLNRIFFDTAFQSNKALGSCCGLRRF